MDYLEHSRPFQRADLWDRFIRGNVYTKRLHNNINVTKSSESTDAIVNQELYSSSRDTYQDLLAAALSVPPRQESWSPLWPVCHRAKPFISSPSVVLDLPNIRNDFCSNLMDWSSTDFLTVAFPSSVYLWYAPTNRTLRSPAHNPCCVKWNPEGTELFTSCRDGTYKLYNIKLQEDVTNSSRPRCHSACFITCAAFHPTNNLLYMGCSSGAFSVFFMDKGLRLVDHVFRYKSAITSLAFSCDGKHIAISNMSSVVGVFNTMGSRPVFEIKLAGLTRALAWHPWDRSCLVVADCLGSLKVFNVLSSGLPAKPLASYKPLYNSAILNITFNPQSAELVVSHRIFSGSTDPQVRNLLQVETQLNVLASLDRVVDRLEGHSGRVPFLSWSPDGSKLATSGSDETARIWNFLPNSKKQSSKKKACKLNYCSAAIEIGNRMGLILR